MSDSFEKKIIKELGDSGSELYKFCYDEHTFHGEPMYTALSEKLINLKNQFRKISYEIYSKSLVKSSPVYFACWKLSIDIERGKLFLADMKFTMGKDELGWVKEYFENNNMLEDYSLLDVEISGSTYTAERGFIEGQFRDGLFGSEWELENEQ